MSTNSVKAFMRPTESFPVLGEKDSLKLALDLMTRYRLGIACITDQNKQLLAVLSDGDLRRLLLGNQSPLPALLVTDAIDFAQRNPITITGDADLISARELMRRKEVFDLPVLEGTGRLVGLLHAHDIE